MNSILEEFAYGNISLQPQSFNPNSELGEAMRFATINEEKLRNKLNEEEKEIFQKYQDAQDEVQQLTAVKNLTHGYRLGVLLTAETFLTADTL